MSRFLLTLALGLSLSGAATGDERPNLILIFSDDHGWPDLGSVGVSDDLRTPHLDQLDADGVRATNGYVTAPQCVPSRGGPVRSGTVASPAKTIHLRVRLPKGNSVVRSIRICSEDGTPVESWQFGEGDGE